VWLPEEGLGVAGPGGVLAGGLIVCGITARPMERLTRLHFGDHGWGQFYLALCWAGHDDHHFPYYPSGFNGSGGEMEIYRPAGCQAPSLPASALSLQGLLLGFAGWPCIILGNIGGFPAPGRPNSTPALPFSPLQGGNGTSPGPWDQFYC